MKGKEAFKIFEDTRLSRKEFCDMVGVSVPTLQRWGNKGVDKNISPTVRDRVILAERACKAGKMSMLSGDAPPPDRPGTSEVPDRDDKSPLSAQKAVLDPDPAPEQEPVNRWGALEAISNLMDDVMDIYCTLKELKKNLRL